MGGISNAERPCTGVVRHVRDPATHLDGATQTLYFRGFTSAFIVRVERSARRIHALESIGEHGRDRHA